MSKTEAEKERNGKNSLNTKELVSPILIEIRSARLTEREREGYGKTLDRRGIET